MASIINYSLLLGVALIIAVSVQAEEPTDSADSRKPACHCEGKQVIGQTAIIEEVSSGAKFLARVDTGAESCSLDAKKVIVEDVDPVMRKNIGKPVKFSVLSLDDKELWIDAKVHSTVIVKTSEEQERRYKVWLTFNCSGTQKRVLVTLNDRSDMEYRFLMGRNFLNDSFLVDVSQYIEQ